MSKPAAITGALVDMKNVATHKCLRLTIDVPAELAMDVIEAMGWPTAVDPVMVAVARLNTNPASAGTALPKAAKRAWADLTYAEQAGIRCTEPRFMAYINARHTPVDINTTEDVVDFVRMWCGVNSRAELKKCSPAGIRWNDLERDFQAWLNAPAYKEPA